MKILIFFGIITFLKLIRPDIVPTNYFLVMALLVLILISLFDIANYGATKRKPTTTDDKKENKDNQGGGFPPVATL